MGQKKEHWGSKYKVKDKCRFHRITINQVFHLDSREEYIPLNLLLKKIENYGEYESANNDSVFGW